MHWTKILIGTLIHLDIIIAKTLPIHVPSPEVESRTTSDKIDPPLDHSLSADFSLQERRQIPAQLQRRNDDDEEPEWQIPAIRERWEGWIVEDFTGKDVADVQVRATVEMNYYSALQLLYCFRRWAKNIAREQFRAPTHWIDISVNDCKLHHGVPRLAFTNSRVFLRIHFRHSEKTHNFRYPTPENWALRKGPRSAEKWMFERFSQLYDGPVQDDRRERRRLMRGRLKSPGDQYEFTYSLHDSLLTDRRPGRPYTDKEW
ncbi:MAG: hypothetical protein M1837_002093 [Sclerophora amabilis]|nr:MAG: hypothetical protein M1837_002093 [Sclerophora amabilis]